MEDQHLQDLRYHWGSCYLIAHPGPDRWIAQRHDDHVTLTAEDPESLRVAIRADYVRRPVPRPPGETSSP